MGNGGVWKEKFMNLEQTRLKEEMLRIVNRWKNKEIPHGHKDYVYKILDRMKYRELKRKLDKFGGKSKKNIVNTAKEIFNEKDN